jgi:hypothetical protein
MTASTELFAPSARLQSLFVRLKLQLLSSHIFRAAQRVSLLIGTQDPHRNASVGPISSVQMALKRLHSHTTFSPAALRFKLDGVEPLEYVLASTA